jgi:Cap4 SAVED domain
VPPSLAYALKQRQSALCTKDKNGTGTEAFLSSITADDLAAALTGDSEALDIHLSLVERDVVIDGCQVKIHCHCLAVDGNGRVQPHRLAEFMRNAVADYAIPRSQLAKAKARDTKYNSTEAVTALVEQARRSFTDLAKTGEGGEMLLFLLAERFLKLPQVLCKMDLKTDTRMHYHGADGVYAGVTPEGILKLYWGESKIYKDAATAIKDCLASIAPFLIEPEHEDAERERDLILLSDKADLSDPGLTAALKRYFDKASPMSKRVKYCAVALVGFNAAFYPGDQVQAVADKLAEAARIELKKWCATIGKRLKTEKLEQVEVELFCLPLPSAEDFRAAFLKAMGQTA